MSILRNLKFNIKALKYLIKEENNYKSDNNFFIKIKLLTNGFTSEKYNLYNLENNNMNEYLSDFQRRNTAKINKQYSILLNDKQLFEQIFQYEGLIPKVHARVYHGEIYLSGDRKSYQQIINLIKTKKTVIIKKIKGGHGKGIYKVNYFKKQFLINDKKMSSTELVNFLKNIDESLITEYLDQADYSKKIYSKTINTIRILIMRDPHTNEPFIATAVHKFGSEKTKPVDNVANGGITSLVNLKTGRLEKAALHNSNNKEITWIKLHPDTGEVIEDSKIPHWNEIKEGILEFTNKLRKIKYVGWDVVVTNSGFKIIEGNNFSDVNILQIHQPLLEDPKIRSFYKYHGII